MNRVILVLIITNAVASFARTNEVKSPILVIEQDLGLSKEKLPEWTKYCKELKIFLSGQPKDKSISHFDKVLCDAPQKPDQLYWTLKFNKIRAASKLIELEFAAHYNSFNRVTKSATFKIDKDYISFLKAIRKDVLKKLLVLQTPFLGRAKADSNKNLFKFDTDEKGNLFAVNISIDENKGFQYQLLGQALKKPQLVKSYGDKFNRYEWDQFFSTQQKTVFLVAVDSKSKEKQEKELTEKLVPETNWLSFIPSLLESLDSSFAGIRYGASLSKGDEILVESNFVSTLVEIRSGPLSGLRFYYDSAPEVSRIREGIEERFEWHRFSLGWSIAFLPEGLLGNDFRTDTVVKLGRSSLDTQFAVEQRGVFSALDFNIPNSVNTGVDLGIEYGKKALRARAWFGVETSALIKFRKDEFTTVRGGLDLNYDVTRVANVDFGFLLFSSIEQLTFSRELENLDSLAIESISYNMSFLGAGVLVSW